MNLQMEDLFSVLTQECFFAADRFKDALGVQTNEEYDVAFNRFSTSFQPIIMWDGLIPEQARQQIVRGVVERSNVADNMHLRVDERFVEYVKSNASVNMQPFLDIFLHAFKTGTCSKKELKYPDERFSQSLFYGSWMEEYPLEAALCTLRSMHYKTNIPIKSEKYSLNERLNIILSQWQNTKEGEFFKNFVKEYSNHPKFSYIIERFGDDPQTRIYMLGLCDFVDFKSVIEPTTQAILKELVAEIFDHWHAFNTERVNILSSMLASEIQERCVGLLKNMEHDMGASLSVTVAPLEKSNVEEFRNKQTVSAPTVSHKI